MAISEPVPGLAARAGGGAVGGLGGLVCCVMQAAVDNFDGVGVRTSQRAVGELSDPTAPENILLGLRQQAIAAGANRQVQRVAQRAEQKQLAQGAQVPWRWRRRSRGWA